MLTAFGQETHTIFLKGVEAHKLHHEFAVATGSTVKRGQPVVLTAEGDVKPATSGEKSAKIIGVTIHNGKEKELVTIAMKAYGVIYAMPNAALDAGPVAYDGLNTSQTDPQGPGFNTATDGTTGIYSSFKAASADGSDLAGWALDQADDANDLIRIAIY